MDYSKTIGKRIMLIRDFRNLSREKLADMTNMTPEGLGKIERGLSNPKSRTMNKLIIALGLSIEDFLRLNITINDQQSGKSNSSMLLTEVWQRQKAEIVQLKFELYSLKREFYLLKESVFGIEPATL